MDRIGIIVPVYNSEQYLDRCIESIMNQTYTEFLLVLIDDGSTDNSGKICDDYARRDTRVHVFHQRNQGQGHARNVALDWIIQKTDVEWITFVDSDDWIHGCMLEYLYRAAKENNALFSLCGYETKATDSEDDKMVIQYESAIIDSEQFYCENTDVLAVVPWGKLYNKKCFSQLRFPEVRACEDEYVTYQVLFMSPDIVQVKAPMYYYYMSEKSTMRSIWTPKKLSGNRAFLERVRFCKKHDLKAAWKKTMQVYVIWGLYGQIEQIEQLENVNQYYWLRKKLLWLLRANLLRYGKRIDVTLDEYLWIYKKAFPCGLELYWMIQNQKKN